MRISVDWAGALTLLVNDVACCKSIEPIGARDLMRLVACQQMSKAPPRRRCCLEAAVAPAGIEIEAF